MTEMESDTELNNTIGDVFKQYLPEMQDVTDSLAKDQEENPEHNQDHELNHETQDPGHQDLGQQDLDMTIDSAFQDALNNMDGDIRKQLFGQDENHGEAEEEQVDDDDFNLAHAIDSAFQNINTEGIRHEELKDHEEHDDKSDKDEGEKKVYSPLQMEKYNEEEDDDLENAIGNAFDELKKSNFDEDKLNKAISDSFHQLVQRNDQASTKISEDVLQELAKEITHQVSEIDVEHKNRTKDLTLPKIDEQVMNHFVNEINREKKSDESFDDSQLQSTIANAVKNVIEHDKDATISTEQLPDDQLNNKDLELNNSQMNDILTNAFNMAMENPTELLNNLETENRELENIDLNKRLSIVESLTSRRTLTDLSNQLSSMMLNLSKTNDSSLISVIKSMTNFLTNSNFQIFKNSQSLISILNNYKNSNLENLFINSLNLSKNYLRANSKQKCITAIDNILILFGKTSTSDILNYNYNLISLITNTIINCIANFQNLKTFKNTFFKKPKLSHLEYKEKIRIENRERKKKWREENSERNKDNDLRARVLKRANNMFGLKDSMEKLNWIEEEFNRRRERRIAKQKKDSGAKGLAELNNDQFIQDRTLVQAVQDFFNIFTNFAPKDDPETGLNTTAVTISCISIIYLLTISPSLEFKRIDVICTNVVNNLLNSFTSIEQQERLIYLAKGSDNGLHDADYFLESISSAATITSTAPEPYLRRVDPELLEDKDTSDDVETSPPNKKLKPIEAMNLKFPAYKNDEKKDLEFKQNNNLNIKNLKKPGTFKKPSYNEKKSKSMTFPQFYSTSIKQ